MLPLPPLPEAAPVPCPPLERPPLSLPLPPLSLPLPPLPSLAELPPEPSSPELPEHATMDSQAAIEPIRTKTGRCIVFQGRPASRRTQPVLERGRAAFGPKLGLCTFGGEGAPRAIPGALDRAVCVR